MALPGEGWGSLNLPEHFFAHFANPWRTLRLSPFTAKAAKKIRKERKAKSLS
jgi:hypothetical protein